MRRPPKPFSKPPAWIVGRDFPHPNDRFQGTVPSNPPADSRRGGPSAPPAVRPSPESSVQPPISSPQNVRPPDADPRKGGPLAPPAVRPPPESSLQSPVSTVHTAPPIAPTSAAEAPPQQQPPSPKPPKTRPSESRPHPPISNIQNNLHSGKCTICNHPDRDLIEAAFLNWQPADRIVAEFGLPARSTLYRHAKAANLLNQRRNDFRSALDQIIEQAGRVPATAHSIISAIELSYRLSGADIAPLKRVETTHIHIQQPNPASAPSRGESSDPPAVRPQNESKNSPRESGHQNILAPPNSLNPKEGHPKESGHFRDSRKGAAGGQT